MSCPTPGSGNGLILTAGPAANGGSCVARHDGRVVFVRYALPGERVRVRVTNARGSYWHAEALEILEPSSHRIPSLCPIAGPHGAGCCDLAFAQPAAARALKGEVVADQLARLGGYEWSPGGGRRAEPVGAGEATGWRTRVRLAVGAENTQAGQAGHAGFHRYHSSMLVTDLDCAQLPTAMLAGLQDRPWTPGAELHVVLDDAGDRHVVRTGPHDRRPEVVEGHYLARQRVGRREWQIPVTGFWQAHREAAVVYSELVAQLAHLKPAMTAWDLYGGAGLFAAVLADAVGHRGRVLTVDTAKAASTAARRALQDLPQVRVVNDSVRRMLAAQRRPADVAVLDPPRSGAGRVVIDLLAAAKVRRVIHIGCEAASFARDVGSYLGHGYGIEVLRVFDSFPLTHHVECVAVLQR
ncbi:MAG: class I SAM-dependent RNA methyltransferase [Mycolicibacterium sp.]|nr:class I SAM-dependent RNA methyltransferase [Mycolicibacterium sp.]